MSRQHSAARPQQAHLQNQAPAATKTYIYVSHKTMTAAVLVDDGFIDPSDETVPIYDVQRVVLHFEDALFIPALITKLGRGGRPANRESAVWEDQSVCSGFAIVLAPI